MLLRLVEALHEALLLLLARHVQEELEDDRSLPRQVVLEMRDVREPLVPDALADELGGSFCRFRISSCTRTTSTSS